MKLKFISNLMLCTGAAITLASCDIDDDNANYVPPVETAAYGVIVNASPNSGDLFFYADSNQVNNTALSYTGANGYYNFHTGDRVLSIRNTVGDTLATADITLTAGAYFSAFAVNTFDNIELVTYTDSLQLPSQGRAYVRFINLTPDAGSIDVEGLNAAFATNLEFKEATEFIEVQSGTYDLSFNDSATEETLFTDAGVNFYAGHIYTIYTKGFVTPAAGSNDTFSTELLRNY